MSGCKASPAQRGRTRQWEGVVRTWYRTKLPTGVYDAETGGVGHVRLPADHPGPPEPFSDAVVDAWEETDMGKAERAVDAHGLSDLPQEVIDATVDMLFNCGAAPLDGLFGRCLKARDIPAAADACLAWCHAGGAVNAGLLNRRKAERQLMLTGAHPDDIVPHEPGLRPDIPAAEIEAQGAALWLSDREDFGARQIPETD